MNRSFQFVERLLDTQRLHQDLIHKVDTDRKQALIDVQDRQIRALEARITELARENQRLHERLP
jgi:hypothetical protein